MFDFGWGEMTGAFDTEFFATAIGGVLIIAGALWWSIKKNKTTTSGAVPPKQVPSTPPSSGVDQVYAEYVRQSDPLARFNTAPSEWAKWTFVTDDEIKALLKTEAPSKLAAKFKFFNQTVQLGGRYDDKNNTYEYQDLLGNFQEDKGGFADYYVEVNFDRLTGLVKF